MVRRRPPPFDLTITLLVEMRTIADPETRTLRHRRHSTVVECPAGATYQDFIVALRAEWYLVFPMRRRCRASN
jgi:hypothetical protein